MNITKYLDCTKFRERIYKKIEAKLISIRQEYEMYSNIVFTSKVIITDKVSSDYIICIDNNIKLSQETLFLSSPIILVLAEGNQKLIGILNGNHLLSISAKKSKKLLMVNIWLYQLLTPVKRKNFPIQLL